MAFGSSDGTSPFAIIRLGSRNLIALSFPVNEQTSYAPSTVSPSRGVLGLFRTENDLKCTLQSFIREEHK